MEKVIGEGRLFCPICKSDGLQAEQVVTRVMSKGFFEHHIQMVCPNGHIAKYFIRQLENETYTFWVVPA